MTLFERMEYAEQAAEGMAWLHGAGCIHCDFKPSNLLFDERTKTVKICDFGLSRLVPYGDVLQGTKVRGSAIYIAPEVAQGQGIDHTADVYAFGEILSFVSPLVIPYILCFHQALPCMNLSNARFHLPITRILRRFCKRSYWTWNVLSSLKILC